MPLSNDRSIWIPKKISSKLNGVMKKRKGGGICEKLKACRSRKLGGGVGEKGGKGKCCYAADPRKGIVSPQSSTMPQAKKRKKGAEEKGFLLGILADD